MYNHLSNFYKAWLEHFGITVESESGMLLRKGGKDGKELLPIEIPYQHPTAGKVKGTLYLPTEARLKTVLTPDVVLFHPMGERVVRGRSEVFNFMFNLVKLTIATNIARYLEVMFTVACNHDVTVNGTPMVFEFIRSLEKQGNAKSDQPYMNKLIRYILDPSHASDVFRMALARSVKHEGSTVYRLLTGKAQILKDLDEEDSLIFDIKPASARALKNAKAMLKFLLDDYYYGKSTEKDSPNFEALYSFYMGFMKSISEKIQPMLDLVGHADIQDFNEFFESMPDFDVINELRKNTIPGVFPGNEGVREEESGVYPNTHQQASTTPMAQKPVQNMTPVQEPAADESPETEGYTATVTRDNIVDDLRRRFGSGPVQPARSQQRQSPPVQRPPVQHLPMQQPAPQQVYQQPVQHPQQQQPMPQPAYQQPVQQQPMQFQQMPQQQPAQNQNLSRSQRMAIQNMGMGRPGQPPDSDYLTMIRARQAQESMVMESYDMELARINAEITDPGQRQAVINNLNIRYGRTPNQQQPTQQVYQQPVYQQPVYQQPVYQQPVYQQPVYQQPVYQQPVYQQAMPQQQPMQFQQMPQIL